MEFDTGDRVVVFKKIHTDIPSYVTIRGWKTFVRYRGQPKTCRSCGKVGHFAKDCPFKRKPDEKSRENRDNPEKKRTDEKPSGDQDVPVNMETTESSVIPTHEELIKDLLDTLTEIEPDPVHSVQDKVKDVQSVSRFSETKPLDSPSVAEAAAVSSEQTFVTGFQHRSFEQFTHDLHQITVERKSSPEHQYILDCKESASLCLIYLYWILGDYYLAQESVSHKMADNHVVMERWKHVTISGAKSENMVVLGVGWSLRSQAKC